MLVMLETKQDPTRPKRMCLCTVTWQKHSDPCIHVMTVTTCPTTGDNFVSFVDRAKQIGLLVNIPSISDHHVLTASLPSISNPTRV